MEEIQVSSQFQPLTPEAVVDQLIDIDSDHSKTDEGKVYAYSTSIAGLDLTLEQGLFDIESRIKNKNVNESGEAIVSIQTLPHHTGHDHELISPIQPVAWVTDGPAAYFNPITAITSKNCLGYWDGRASSLPHFLWQNFTSSCFIGFHCVVLLAISFALFTKYSHREYYVQHPSVRTTTVKLLILVPLLYDLFAFLFLAIKNSLPNKSHNPIEATRVQYQASSFIKSKLVAASSHIPHKQVERISQSVESQFVKGSQLTGAFIIRFFYEPAISSLVKELRPSGGAFSPNNATRLNWSQIEALFTLYRYLREISDSIVMGNNDISAVELPDAQRNLIRKVFISSITKGPEDAFQQLLRLLKNACAQPSERSAIVKRNYRDLSLNHYIGSEAVDLIKKDLEKETQRLNKAAAKTGGNPRFDAILQVLHSEL